MKASLDHVARTALTATLAVALAACGGGGPSAPPPTGGTPTPTPPVSTCSVANQIAFADDVLNEWYLFPDLLDDTVDPDDFDNVQDFLDARVAPAADALFDRGFTFATSIAEENEAIRSGGTAGIGVRLGYDVANRRVFILEAYENAPGFQAGLDRGSELLAIGTSSSNLQTVSELFAQGGAQAVVNALGPSQSGVTRVIRFRQIDGDVIERSISKTEFELDPISDRNGVRIFEEGGRKIGYLNLRTFIVGTADRQLVEAFQRFSDEGVTEFVFDFRYNGGGLVRIAGVLGDLLRGPNTGEVFSRTLYRDSKSDRNQTRRFMDTVRLQIPGTDNFEDPIAIPRVNPEKVAFITTRATASASELVINSLLPYVDEDNIAIIGEDTSGKPVGQGGFDFEECDLRIRAVTFETVNADGQGRYFDGLAELVPNTCRAFDDISNPLGSREEDSIMTALDFLAGRSCTPFVGQTSITGQSVGGRRVLQPERPNAIQHENPGLF
ncbi:MAG: S41 family peptidase [Erythrobacter sp.]